MDVDSTGDYRIELLMLRHGQTPGNAERRYVGSSDDQPLSDQGREEALSGAALFEDLGFADVRRVYVSSLRRTQETAALLFPNAEQLIVDGIQEMDFGDFTGRTSDEMADDVAYRAWVDGGCLSACPNGESKAAFDDRVCEAMVGLLRAAAQRGESTLYMVVHGGTLMAFLSHYTHEGRAFYEWNVGNCQGYRVVALVGAEDVRIVSTELL